MGEELVSTDQLLDLIKF